MLAVPQYHVNRKAEEEEEHINPKVIKSPGMKCMVSKKRRRESECYQGQGLEERGFDETETKFWRVSIRDRWSDTERGFAARLFLALFCFCFFFFKLRSCRTEIMEFTRGLNKLTVCSSQVEYMRFRAYV